jgi:hypothetical protein
LCLLHFILLLLLLLFFFFLSSAKSLSDTFLGDYGNRWNFTGMLSIMSRCTDYFQNFQNGCRCHGNGQNAKNWKTQKWS